MVGVFLQRSNEKRELRRGETGEVQAHLPKFRFDGGKIILYSRNREGVESEELKK
jgi:hypothetical protein